MTALALLALLAGACGALGGEGPSGGTRSADRPTAALGPGDEPAEGAAAEFATDFTKHSVPYSEILSGGPPKDGILAINDPRFVGIEAADYWLEPKEPIILFKIGDDVRAHPIQIIMWHEIVNDTVGGGPVVVTFCPLCNTAIAFERTMGRAKSSRSAPRGGCAIPTWSCTIGRPRAGGSRLPARPLPGSLRAGSWISALRPSSPGSTSERRIGMGSCSRGRPASRGLTVRTRTRATTTATTRRSYTRDQKRRVSCRRRPA